MKKFSVSKGSGLLTLTAFFSDDYITGDLYQFIGTETQLVFNKRINGEWSDVWRINVS